MRERGNLLLLLSILPAVVVALVVGILADSEALAAQARPDAQPHRLFATSAVLGIVEIDPGTGAVLNTFAAPVNQGVSDGLAFDGTTLYYLSGSIDSNTLYALNPNTGAVKATYSLPDSAFRNGLATLNGLVYILDWSILTQDITIFDPGSGTVVGTLDIDGVNPGAPLISGGLAGITRPDALLVTTNTTNEVLEINPQTGAITRQWAHSQGNGTLGAAAVNGRVYLGSNTSATLSIYERDGTPAGTVTVDGPGGIQSLGGDDVFPYAITKAVTPTGTVNPGALLTYTFHISTAPGAELGLYDPLSGTAFVGFVAPSPPGVIHDAGAITGTLLVTPSAQLTLGVVVEVGGDAGLTVSNRACLYALPDTLDGCRWSNEVDNDVRQPPGVPLLLMPPDGLLTATQTITFTWQAGPGEPPDGYNWQLDGVVVTLTETTTGTLLATGVHTWTARAFNATGFSNWATAWTVEVEPQQVRYSIYLPLLLRRGAP